MTPGDLVIIRGPSAIGDRDRHLGRIGRVYRVVPPGERNNLTEPYVRVEFIPNGYRRGDEWSGYSLSALAPAGPDDPGVMQWLLWILES